LSFNFAFINFKTGFETDFHLLMPPCSVIPLFDIINCTHFLHQIDPLKVL